MSLVQAQGALNWVRIAQTLGSRTPKQCRERYHQNLKPNLNHEPITADEGLLIERLVRELGKRWAEISRRLRGRSDNAVKNWWNGSQNRRKRLDQRLDRRRAIHSPIRYTERGGLSSLPAPNLSLNRPLPRPNFSTPQPLSPIYLRQSHYGVEAPLLSPSSSEPQSGEAYDGAPSLISDSGSSDTTSPRALPSSLCTPVQLPPLRNLERSWLHSSSPDSDSRLPGLGSLAKPGLMRDATPRLPPIYENPACPGGVSYLPTAPNSPEVTERPPPSPPTTKIPADKDSRMDVSALLAH